MATAIIGARIDYCNSLPYGTTGRNLNRLQKIQNATARIVHRASDDAPTAAVVTDQNTDHVQAGDPYFQGEVLSDPTVSSRTASRPSGCQNTSIYYHSTVSLTSRAFYYSAPQVWNCLGTSTRSANTFSHFRRCLKF